MYRVSGIRIPIISSIIGHRGPGRECIACQDVDAAPAGAGGPAASIDDVQDCPESQLS